MGGNGYTVTDRRGMNEGQEHPDEVCRVCGAKAVHTKEYSQPTMDCVRFLQNRIKVLENEAKG